MTAATFKLPEKLPNPSPDTEPCGGGIIARKRRRQILQNHRTKGSTAELVTSNFRHSTAKRHCIEAGNAATMKTTTTIGAETTIPKTIDTHSALNCAIKDTNTQPSLIPVSISTKPSRSACTKKPQMRYDPEVPMTKEAAAAWRREQRRKRNRESAAASRQRQRDRISELEIEVGEWKAKFEEAIARLSKLEQLHGTKEQVARQEYHNPQVSSHVSLSSTDDSSVDLSNPCCPSLTVSPTPSPVLSSIVAPSIVEEHQGLHGLTAERELHERTKGEHLTEILRPAVKITGAPFDSLLAAPAHEEPLPDPCTSDTNLLMPQMCEITPTPLSQQYGGDSVGLLSDEDDKAFDDFLMDAVQWL